MLNVFEDIEKCLYAKSPQEKISKLRDFSNKWQVEGISLQSLKPPLSVNIPGRPDKPSLVNPKLLPKRSHGTLERHAALMHAIAHIEFNAINLACDAIYRFRNMPQDYYANWLSIGLEEANHFEMIDNYLRSIGYSYGDFSAHNGLWEMAIATADDVLSRMALVPRVLEARGLDVTPAIIKKLQQHGYSEAADILAVIYKEEHAHVASGNHWFKYLCAQRELDPEPTFKQLIVKHASGKIALPLNREARLAAGFSQQELNYLEDMAGTSSK